MSPLSDREAADAVIKALQALTPDGYSLVQEAMTYWDNLQYHSDEEAADMAREHHAQWVKNREGTSEPVPPFALPGEPGGRAEPEPDTSPEARAQIKAALAAADPVAGRLAELACLDRTGKSHEPDRGKPCWCGMTHVPATPGVVTQPAGGYPADGEPEGAYINDDGPGHGYSVTLYGSHVGQYAQYPDALDHLRIDVVDQRADPERLDVFYVAHATDLWVLLPRLDEIDSRWDRPDVPRPEDLVWWASLGSHVGVEAMCALCGQTFNPHGPTADDLTHMVTINPPDDHVNGEEAECGGPGVLLGAWG